MLSNIDHAQARGNDVRAEGSRDPLTIRSTRHHADVSIAEKQIVEGVTGHLASDRPRRKAWKGPRFDQLRVVVEVVQPEASQSQLVLRLGADDFRALVAVKVRDGKPGRG